MDVRECLLTRRSIRKYKDEPLSDELLNRIMEAAMAAPSAVNRQNWYFVVVRSPVAMYTFKSIMYRIMLGVQDFLKERFAKNPEVVEHTKNFLVSLGNAPVCVLAFQLKPEYNGDAGAIQSVAAAIENLLLAAWSEGVGTCWMSPHMSTELKEEIQNTFAPDKGEFVAAITMGWPDQNPKMPKRREGRYTFM